MDLLPIRDYIASEKPFYETAHNLFVYSMPPQVNIGVLIVTEPSGAEVDHEIAGVYKNRFQIIVRHSDYEAGQAMAIELFHLLNIRAQALGDYWFYYIRPRHLPIPYRRGESDLMEFSINYDTHFADYV